MKAHSVLLLAAALLVSACSPKRLSPVVQQEHAPAKAAPAKPSQHRPVTTASSGKSTVVRTPGSATRSAKAPVRHATSSSRSRADEAARLAERKRRQAAIRRIQMRKLAEASYEAGRQLLRENQAEPALKAFRESVRLNSHSPDAWMGVAYVCEITGNTKDAVEAFRAAKRLWGM